jgi:hypothetical protein
MSSTIVREAITRQKDLGTRLGAAVGRQAAEAAVAPARPSREFDSATKTEAGPRRARSSIRKHTFGLSVLRCRFFKEKTT